MKIICSQTKECSGLITDIVIFGSGDKGVITGRCQICGIRQSATIGVVVNE